MAEHNSREAGPERRGMREGFCTGLHPGSMLTEGGMHSGGAGGERVRMMGTQLDCTSPKGSVC